MNKIKSKIKKLITWETYEDIIISILKFFIKRNPIALINKNFNQKHPYLSASTSMVLILTLIITSSWFLFFKKTQPVAAWWDDTWGYRKAIQISNSNGEDLTDFQVAITIDTATLISEGKLQSQCQDLRFTDKNGNLLPYWIEENNPGCNNSATKVWIKIPTVYDGTNATTIYTYYGKSSASDKQNGDEVFEFFDDFNDEDLSEWQAESSSASWTISNNQLENYNSSDYGAFTISENFKDTVLDVRWKHSGGSHWGLNFRGQDEAGDNGYNWILRSNNNSRIQKRTSGSQVTLLGEISTGKTLSSDIWFNLSFKFIDTNINAYIDGDQVLNGDIADSTYTIGKVGFQGWDGTNFFDNFRVRKAISTDPTAGTPTSEEKSKGPVGYWSFDEGYGTTANDGSGKGSDGTISGATWQTEDQCVVGKCLRFDGTNSVSITNPLNQENLEQEWTVSAWVKLNENTGDGTQNLVEGINRDLSLNYSSTDKALLYLNSGDNDYYVYGTTDLKDGNWHYITFAFRNSDGYRKIYIDGEDDSSSGPNKTSTPSGISSTLSIGSGVRGHLDEVKIYSYVRTEEEIKQDYNAGLAAMSTPKGSSVAIGSESPAWMSDGLVGYWKMDEASWNGTTGEVVDASGNGNHGVTYGDATIGKGKFGSGGLMDGVDDYIYLPQPGGSEISLGMWISKDFIDGRRAIKMGGGAGVGEFIMDFEGDDFGIYLGGGTPVAGYHMTNNGGIQNNQFHYLLWTYDKSNLKLYIDGELKKEVAVSRENDFISDYIKIGDPYGVNTEDFKGLVDEVRFYNRVLSLEEVKGLYEYAPGPVLHLKMDEGSGTTAYDTSGNENNGTLTNGPTWIEGKYGKAVEIRNDGEYVSIGDPASLNFQPTDSFSMGGWVTVKDVSPRWFSWLSPPQWASNTSYGFLGRGFAGPYVGIAMTASWTGDLYDSNTEPEFNGLSFNFGRRSTVGSSYSSSVNLNERYYLFFVYTPEKQYSYINGKLVDSRDSSGLETAFSGNWNVFHEDTSYGGNPEAMFGIVDDIKIYNYARTEKQIMEDMLGSDKSTSGGDKSGGEGSQVAYWKFDEGYGTTAYDSVGDNDGTITGASWTNDGKFGKALSFDGSDDYMDISSSTLGATAVSLWVKSTQSGVRQAIASGLIDDYIIYFDTSGKIGSGTTNVSGVATQSSGFDDGEWHHLYIQKNDTNDYTIYIDGINESGGASSGYRLTSKAMIAASEPNLPFKGQIDEVKIYNYALSENEVKKDYNQGKALVMGAPQSSSGATGQAADYCVPGDTATCNPPVAEWKFDEMSGATAYDTSGNGNDGNLNGNPNWTGLGKVGSALSFDGSDDYVNFNKLYNETPFTSISLWMKANSISQTSAVAGAFREGSYWDRYGRGIKFIDGYVYAMGEHDHSNEQLSYLVNDLEWHHISVNFTSDGGLFVDGKKVAAGNLSDSTNYYFGIGGCLGTVNDTAVYNFNGQIDDVRIYDYARTPAQIAWDYNRGKPIAHWKMDEGEGTTVHDESGNGNHGMMTNMSSDDWVDGKNNGALDFDGVDDYVSITLLENLKINQNTGGVTMSAWINYEQDSNKNTWYTTLKGVGETYDSWLLRHDNYYNQIGTGKYYSYIRSEEGNIMSLSSVGSNALNGEWHFITAVFDTSQGKFIYYENGKFIGSHNVDYSINTFDFKEFQISTSSNDFKPYGKIDDVQIYNYALTAEQIKNIYNGGAINYK